MYFGVCLSDTFTLLELILLLCLCYSSQQVKAAFFEMLSEQEMKDHPHWHKVKAMILEDPRYKAIESSHRRKDLFKEYTQKHCKVQCSRLSVNSFFVPLGICAWTFTEFVHTCKSKHFQP